MKLKLIEKEDVKRRTYSGKIEKLPENGIFVFGSNTQGRHGKGAALFAKENFGAIYGQAKGLQGQSYAIVTKDLTKSNIPSRSPFDIMIEIINLYDFAIKNPDKDFYIIYSGYNENLNGYSNIDMAGFFSNSLFFGEFKLIPNNIIFELKFYELMKSCARK